MHTHTHTHTHMHTHMHSHTHIHMYIQELGGNIHGDCSDFEVVPGYGLKCTVSGLEEYSRGETQHSGTIVIRHTCVTPETSLVAESGEGASQAKKYQVKGEGEGERREKGRGREKEWRDKGRERGSLCDSSLHLQVLIGNRGWMSQNGVEIVGDMEKDIQGFEEHGQTVVMVAIDGEYYEGSTVHTHTHTHTHAHAHTHTHAHTRTHTQVYHYTIATIYHFLSLSSPSPPLLPRSHRSHSRITGNL